MCETGYVVSGKTVRMYGFKLEGGGVNGLKRVFTNFSR